MTTRKEIADRRWRRLGKFIEGWAFFIENGEGIVWTVLLITALVMLAGYLITRFFLYIP